MPQVDEALANVVSWLHKGSKMGCEVASLIQRTADTIQDMQRAAGASLGAKAA